MGSSPRLVADDLRSLAVRQAPAAGERATLVWRSGAGEVEASAVLECEGQSVALLYRWREGEAWRACRRTIALKFDVPYLGGRRRFWRCLNCGLNARKLFDIGAGEFRCRRCGRLVDRSQRLKTWQRALRRAARLRAYCGGSGGAAEPFPTKPPRMRWAVYLALKEETLKLEKSMPAEAWLSADRNIPLGVRRSPMAATRRRWWPGRNNRRAG